MGLFDKLKNAVKGVQDAVAPAPAPPPQSYAAAEPAEPDDEDSASDDGDSDGDGDDWGGLDPNDHQGMWYRVKQCEYAGIQQGDDAADAKAREYGLKDFAHMSRVRATFDRHFGHTHEYTQAALNAVGQSSRETLGAAASQNSEIFQPVEGISLEVYAKTQASAGSIGNDMGKWAQILAGQGMDQAKWDRVSAEWTRRMSGQASPDMNATHALLAEYGKFFGQGGQGAYGASAAANADSAGLYQQGQGAQGAEPVSMERYAEIGGAQSAWAQQGRDVNAMLQQQFGISAIDWSNMSQYWSAKMTSDYRVAVQLMDLQTGFEKQYLGAAGGHDDDLEV